MRADPVHLIIGCGYLGNRLSGLLTSKRVWITGRTNSQSNNSILLDINNKATWSNLGVIPAQPELIIYFLVPTSQVDPDLFGEFTNRLNDIKPFRNILISSTVVFGNRDRIVNADSDVEIDNTRAERQYIIEQIWLSNLGNSRVVRLAGIYGPERIIGFNNILQGEVIRGDPEGWLNLIHVDDAASLIKRIGETKLAGQTELGCDGKPIKRDEYYSFLAGLLHKPLPSFKIDKQSRGVGRRCDNKLTLQRTGWQPGHINYKKALTELINR